MGATPGAGGEFIGLGQGRVDVDGGEDFVQAELVFHGEDELGNQIAGVGTDNSDAEDAIAARWREYFDEAARVAVGDGAIQILNVITSDFVGDVARVRLKVLLL